MVHALEEIRWMLISDGCLVEIHPVPEWLFLGAIQRGNILSSEPKPMIYTQDIIDAKEAVAEVVARGLFVIEESDEFDFLTYASSVDEFRSYWTKLNAYDDRPEDETFLQQEEEQFARFHGVLQDAGEGSEIFIHEKGKISRLRPVR
ncbi:MAG: hypothetical protein PVI99_09080 [Anaerolineales bacterium]